MSWKVHETDEVFAALRGLCSNAYRMYDPCEYRYYYDHECDAYECVVEDAAREYERLLSHCNHQREELAKLTRYVQGEAPAETIGILMELLNEYRESGCAIDESRVSWYAARLDGRTEDERMDERMSITDELRGFIENHLYLGATALGGWKEAALIIADRIDERYRRDMATAQQVGYNDGEDAAMRDGWVKLPTDADGVPINVGDELTNGEDIPAKVRYMVLGESGWMVSTRELHGYGVPPAALRHVQPDSWESIIKDATAYRTYDKAPCSISELVERCRRLAGEGA